MANSSRNLIVLSDGTGNSASTPFKTNVWRLYQAINLTDGSQVAVFGDGVGTSSVKILRVLGLALGVGVKRNVLNLYKFLCRNYKAGDHIWAFGFSRGAFTVRVLVGLIHREGLVSFNSEAELARNALAAYRAYRRKAFSTYIPWVLVGRMVRDLAVSIWNDNGRTILRGGRRRKLPGSSATPSSPFRWGLGHRRRLRPADRRAHAGVDKWVWPMKFRDVPCCLCAARRARSDLRRRTQNVPSDSMERKHGEGSHRQTVCPPGRLRQVWFAGAHSDVGGGYPDDGLSLVPLCWMIDEAANEGLRFEPSVVAAAIAAPTGRIYDSRSGFVEQLCARDAAAFGPGQYAACPWQHHDADGMRQRRMLPSRCRRKSTCCRPRAPGCLQHCGRDPSAGAVQPRQQVVVQGLFGKPTPRAHAHSNSRRQ